MLLRRFFCKKVHKDNSVRKLCLCKKYYVEKVLNIVDIRNSKVVNTPLTNHFKLSLDQCPKTDGEVEYMSHVLYVNDVGCLMHVMVCTRPNLAHVVSQVFKIMSN